MSIQSSKQCPNCTRWFTTQKSFKHHIRHCRRTNCEETLNDFGISAANPLLSNFTPGVETNVFQQSNLTQLYEDEYDDFQQIEGLVDSTFDSDSRVNNNEELMEDMDDNTSLVRPQIRLMAVTKIQVLLNDLLIKHKASLLLYDEICHLFKEYISSPNFDRFVKFKSRRSLLTSTQKTFNSKALLPINGTVRLHDNTLVTVSVFDTKHMIISLLTDPSVMNKKNFAEGYNVLTGLVDNLPANNKYGEVHTVMHGFLQGIGTVKTRPPCLLH
jgi:hypothetical protein